jgi:hypothetical protein
MIISLLVFIPIFIQYGRKAGPYFVALTQHSFVGDYFTGGGIKLFWPLGTSRYYGLGINITAPINIFLEWIFFLICFIMLLKTRDVWTLIQPHSFNHLLSIPIFAVLLPVFVSFPLYVPLQLVIPHLTYLTLFTISILIYLKALLKKH